MNHAKLVELISEYGALRCSAGIREGAVANGCKLWTWKDVIDRAQEAEAVMVEIYRLLDMKQPTEKTPGGLTSCQSDRTK